MRVYTVGMNLRRLRGRKAWVCLGPTIGLLACAPRLSVGEPCTRNGECSDGYVCGVGGRCREECIVSADCILGARCLRDPVSNLNGCSLATDSCSAGSCEGGLRCVEGECLGVCLADDECPDHVCRDGACQIPSVTIDAGEPDAGMELDANRDGGLGCANAPAWSWTSRWVTG